MTALDSQLPYWNTVGVSKTYSHPIDLTWLGAPDAQARIIDYGCGYGRLTGLLHEAGWANVEGFDIAPAVIDRARKQWPQLTFRVLDHPPVLPYAAASVAAVVLFAVLTCIPADAAQRRLVEELHRVLQPGGKLYLSDFLIQEDRRNLARYQQFETRYGTYGVFETGDGAVCRHHSLEWLHELLHDFELNESRQVAVNTMNNHPATTIQVLATKPRL